MKTNKKIPEYRFAGYSDAWEQWKLGDVVEMNPKSNLPNEFEYVDLESVVGTELVSHRREMKGTAPSRAQRLAKKGDVFYQTVRPYQRNNYLFNLEANNYVFSTGYAQLRPKSSSKFLLAHIQTTRFVNQVLDNCTGTSYPAINSSDLASLTVNFPTLPEQTVIGDFFQTLDRSIALHQRKSDVLKERKKSLLQKMFPSKGQKIPEIRFPGFSGDWEEKKLGEVANKFDNLRIPVSAKDRVSGITPYYGANGIQDYVEGYTHDGEYVLIAEDGANDLRDYPIQYVNGKVWVNNHAHVVQGKTDLINNKFLLFAIKQINIEPYLVGGGRAKLNAEVMMTLPLIIPALPEQEAIGAFFQTLDLQIQQQEERLQQLKETKQTLLKKLFV